MSEVYKFEVNDEDNPSVYSFYSMGKETVLKVVSMQPVPWEDDVVNLVLADEISPGVAAQKEIQTMTIFLVCLKLAVK